MGTMIDSSGLCPSATMSMFGFCSYGDVILGGTYTIFVASRRFRFTPRVIEANSNLTDIDLLGKE